MSVLEAKNISKKFPGVLALDSVDISFEPGEIHAVIGENGAGKSTLIKCLTGVYIPEEGEVLVEGRNAIKNKDLFKKVAYVPQEIDLFKHMTVAENLFMPFEKFDIKGTINQRELGKKALPILEKFNIPVSPSDLVKDISVSSQQLLQIARAVSNVDYEVLMLDEPTTSLTVKDTKILFDIVKRIASENKAVVFISHKLEEIFELCDVITVFRNGKRISYAKISEVDDGWIVKQMTGREKVLDQKFYSEKVSNENIMEVKKLSGERFHEVSFNLRRGEILGFTGLVGAGRSELMQAILGILPIYSGEIIFEGEPWKKGDSNWSVSKGYIYLPEERKKDGILPMLSIRENISITALDSLRSGLGLSRTKEQDLADDIIKLYDIKTPDADKQIQFLSGGNQQKVIIGRSMNAKPKVLVFDEPTKGIDVGTKIEIYKLMKRLAEEEQIGIIMISSEMEEIMKCSNRIIALYDGHNAGEYNASTDDRILLGAIIATDKVKQVTSDEK